MKTKVNVIPHYPNNGGVGFYFDQYALDVRSLIQQNPTVATLDLNLVKAGACDVAAQLMIVDPFIMDNGDTVDLSYISASSGNFVTTITGLDTYPAGTVFDLINGVLSSIQPFQGVTGDYNPQVRMSTNLAWSNVLSGTLGIRLHFLFPPQ